MKRRHYLGWIVVLIMIVGLVVIGNIITIGEKIGAIHPWLEWGFYVIFILFVIFFIIWPLLRTILTPEIGGDIQKNVSQMMPAELTEYIKKLKLNKDERTQINIAINRAEAISEFLAKRSEKFEGIIKDFAQDVFIITAISQSGSFDLLSSIAINFQMVNKLIRQYGYRPSYYQLLKMYVSIVSASLVITSLDDIIDDIDFKEIAGTAGIVFSNIFFRSAANGAMNAFVCLKVGFATIKYLEMGGKRFTQNKLTIRSQIRKQARINMPTILKEGILKGRGKISSFCE